MVHLEWNPSLRPIDAVKSVPDYSFKQLRLAQLAFLRKFSM